PRPCWVQRHTSACRHSTGRAAIGPMAGGGGPRGGGGGSVRGAGGGGGGGGGGAGGGGGGRGRGPWGGGGGGGGGGRRPARGGCDSMASGKRLAMCARLPRDSYRAAPDSMTLTCERATARRLPSAPITTATTWYSPGGRLRNSKAVVFGA